MKLMQGVLADGWLLAELGFFCATYESATRSTVPEVGIG